LASNTDVSDCHCERSTAISSHFDCHVSCINYSIDFMGCSGAEETYLLEVIPKIRRGRNVDGV